MKLYILRHADAESVRTTDMARELTPLGVEQARTVGRHCVGAEIRPAIILTSPYRRALQTAEALAEATGAPLQKEAFLASGMTPPEAIDGLGAYAKFDPVLIVGHQPDLGDLIRWLLGLGDDEHFSVGKASLTFLHCPQLAPGAATLVFTRPVQEM